MRPTFLVNLKPISASYDDSYAISSCACAYSSYDACASYRLA